MKNNVPVPENCSTFHEITKPELLLIAKNNSIPTKYLIESLADQCDKEVKVLWLPPAHCEFNPIELVWAYVKNYVAVHNKGNTIQGIYELSLQALSKVTPQLWSNCIKHAKKYECKMWERDRLVDDCISTLRETSAIVISINGNESDSDSDEFEYEDQTETEPEDA